MKSIVMFVLALIALNISPASAEARLLGKLSKTLIGVSVVLEKAGCHQDWLSQSIKDSPGITETNLNGLPIGQEVYLNVTSCRKAPPASVALASRLIRMKDSRVAELTELQREVSRLRGAEKSANITAIEKQFLSDQFDALALEYRKLELRKQAGEDQAESLFPFSDVLAISIGMLLVGSAIGFYAYRVREKGMARLPRSTISMKVEDETYIFKRVGIKEDQKGTGILKGLYECPACHDELAGHFHDHLKKRCTRIPRSLHRDPDGLLPVAHAHA